MENTFDSTYIIRKDKYDEFVAGAERLAMAVYTIPAFAWLELYQIIDMDNDIVNSGHSKPRRVSVLRHSL